MTTLCLTGWQQDREALSAIAPHAVHFDYASFTDTPTLLKSLPTCDTAIGWSLGGLLLVKAIAEGLLKPKKLFLLAAPFQFVKSNDFAYGISEKEFAEARSNYENHTLDMLESFQSFVALGDSKQTEITRQLRSQVSLWQNGLFWLDELKNIRCGGFDFWRFPDTIIVHGKNDKVTHPANAEKFTSLIPRAQLVLLPDCAHAIHLHDPERITQLVNSGV